MTVPPLASAGLALGATLTLIVSPVAALVAVTVVVVGLALVDGRPRTAIAIVGGQTLFVAGALSTLALALQAPPPGSRSQAGLAFIVMPFGLVLSATAIAALFATVHQVRRRGARVTPDLGGGHTGPRSTP